MDNNQTLFSIIQSQISNALKKVGYDKTGTILKVKEDGSFYVLIDGYQYIVKNGIGVNFNQGDRCLIHYVNGNQNEKIIIAKL